MKRPLCTATMGLIALAYATQARAHRIDEYLQATLLSVQAGRVQASMRLVPGEVLAPSVIAGIDTNGDGVFSEPEKTAYARRVLSDLSITVDAAAAVPTLDSWRFPAPSEMRSGLGEVRLDYTVTLPPRSGDRTLTLYNHHRAGDSVYLVNVLAPDDAVMRILGQKRDPTQSRYEVDFRLDAGAMAGDAPPPAPHPAWWRQLGLDGLFALGMRHISDGTDHLLFLLALLLPAPLLVADGRWGPPASARRSLLRSLAIVTAFTVGHSASLIMTAAGGWTAPGRLVEVVIAASIFVSAVHALRPMFAGREAAVAAAFGLVHGLAFAATLDRLGLGLWPRVAGTLAFNLGIEAMQLFVVAAVLPSLLLMSRTPAYRALRVGGALIAGTASLLWITERWLGIDTHVDAVASVLAHHGVVMASTLLVIATSCFAAGRRRLVGRPAIPPASTRSDPSGS